MPTFEHIRITFIPYHYQQAHYNDLLAFTAIAIKRVIHLFTSLRVSTSSKPLSLICYERTFCGYYSHHHSDQYSCAEDDDDDDDDDNDDDEEEEEAKEEEDWRLAFHAW